MPESHLPECSETLRRNYAFCICDRLRACAARVRAFYDAEIEKQGAQWEAACRQFYRSGSDDGKALALDAAREAVAAKAAYWRERADRSDEESLVGRRYANYADAHDADLAAIDGLREESQR